jgi:hypothetical protein
VLRLAGDDIAGKTGHGGMRKWDSALRPHLFLKHMLEYVFGPIPMFCRDQNYIHRPTI